jgi:protein-tyrosine phosphatase
MTLEHFTDLDDHIAVGSYPHTPEQIESLVQTYGVSAVVNLQSDADLRQRGVQWSVLWPFYIKLKVSLMRIPIIDFDRADLGRNMDQAVEAVGRFVDEGRKVYIHCNAGLNRSPSVVVGHLVAARGLGLAEAMDWLAQRHECVPYPDVLEHWVRRRDYAL